jgi:CDP-diacylglycerol--glycerol-3-phosphate 3-phosphatidyltransferase
MLTVPNIITLLRLPLALFFLQESVPLRVFALVFAMLSDILDGLIARRYGQVSSVGSFLDPLADKFFVFFVLSIFLIEERLHYWQAATMLCRDFSVLLFGCYLGWKGTLSGYQFRSILSGKIMTLFQFVVLLALLFRIAIPEQAFFSFMLVGMMMFVELYLDRAKLKVRP